MPRASLAIQVLPLDSADALAAVDAAIDSIQASGVAHDVGPMETTLEGDDPEELMRVCLRAHRAALEAGAEAVQSNIRLIERPAGLMTMGEKTRPHRSRSDP